MIEAVGLGLDIAAAMLITSGDNADRVRSEPAFAKMCVVCAGTHPPSTACNGAARAGPRKRGRNPLDKVP
jgi:hypothetical protein